MMSGRVHQRERSWRVGSSTAVQTKMTSPPTYGTNARSEYHPLLPIVSNRTIHTPRNGTNATHGFLMPRRRPMTYTGNTRTTKRTTNTKIKPILKHPFEVALIVAKGHRHRLRDP